MKRLNIFILLIFSIQACAHLPVESEKVIGKPVSNITNKIFDAISNKKLDEIGSKIVQCSDLPKRKIYEFKIALSREINAFATWGGYIYVFLGIFEVVDTEDELAAVIAHEVSHVAKRHIAQGLDWQLPFNLIGEIVPIVTLGIVPNPVELSFSRTHEKEADLKALEYMKCAGYSPKGMEILMEKFFKMYEFSQYVPYLESHPPSKKRLERIKRWMELKGGDDIKLTPLDKEMFLRIK